MVGAHVRALSGSPVSCSYFHPLTPTKAQVPERIVGALVCQSLQGPSSDPAWAAVLFPQVLSAYAVLSQRLKLFPLGSRIFTLTLEKLLRGICKSLLERALWFKSSHCSKALI